MFNIRPKEGHSAPKVGGKNSDADALQAKIAAKKAAKEAGTFAAKTKGGGTKAPGKKDKAQSMVHPHTGKKDPAYTAKMMKKG